MVNRWLAIDNSVTTVNKRCSEIYDVILNKWSNYNEMIIERDDFCVVLAEDDLFILGGQCWKEKICTNSVIIRRSYHEFSHFILPFMLGT